MRGMSLSSSVRRDRPQRGCSGDSYEACGISQLRRTRGRQGDMRDEDGKRGDTHNELEVLGEGEAQYGQHTLERVVGIIDTVRRFFER